MKEFWDRVNKESSPDACWVWTGTRSPRGYGQMYAKGDKRVRAHRVSWALHFGAIPDGLSVCHKCDNPPCVNPSHLFLGTQKDNIQDMVRKGRALSGDKNPARVYPEKLARGERHGSAKLSADDVAQIRASHTGERGEHTRLAKEYGVTRKAIAYVVNEGWK